MDLIALLYPIGAGALSGVGIALLGYAKNVNNPENFEPAKAVQTIIIGAFIGGAAGYYGMTYTNAETWLGSIGAITIVEYLKKAIWKALHKPTGGGT